MPAQPSASVPFQRLGGQHHFSQIPARGLSPAVSHSRWGEGERLYRRAARKDGIRHTRHRPAESLSAGYVSPFSSLPPLPFPVYLSGSTHTHTHRVVWVFWWWFVFSFPLRFPRCSTSCHRRPVRHWERRLPRGSAELRRRAPPRRFSPFSRGFRGAGAARPHAARGSRVPRRPRRPRRPLRAAGRGDAGPTCLMSTSRRVRPGRNVPLPARRR